MPPQGFYQEAGRAGRDGAPARCVLLYAPRDIPRFLQLLRGKGKAAKERAVQHLEEASIGFDICHGEVFVLSVDAPPTWVHLQCGCGHNDMKGPKLYAILKVLRAWTRRLLLLPHTVPVHAVQYLSLDSWPTAAEDPPCGWRVPSSFMNPVCEF